MKTKNDQKQKFSVSTDFQDDYNEKNNWINIYKSYCDNCVENRRIKLNKLKIKFMGSYLSIITKFGLRKTIN